MRASCSRDGRAGRAVVRAHEAGDVLRVVVGAHDDVARLAPAARCRPRCAGRPAPPGSARAGAIRLQQRARAGATRPSRPAAGRARPGRRSSRQAAAPSKRSTLGRATCARRGRRPRRPTKGRLSVATSATSASPSSDLHREHDAEQLHRRDCARVGSARGAAGTQGPAERGRRLLPRIRRSSRRTCTSARS